MTAAATVGLCHCCDQPVQPGDERHMTVEQGSGAAPDVLLHRYACRPPAVRRYLPRTH